MIDRHGQPRRPGLTAQVDKTLRARRHHRHGQARVGEQQVIVEPADADDIDLGGHRAAARKRPRSMTTVPSCVRRLEHAPPSPAPRARSSRSNGQRVAGQHRAVNRPAMDAKRAGSEPHSACSSARPVKP